MGSDKSAQLRDAALRAVHSTRRALGSLAEDFIPPTLRLEFSGVLKATVSPDTLLGRDISDEEARDEVTAKQNLRYLQILFSLAENDLWAHQLRNDGHLDICLTIANEIEFLKIFPLKDQLALYTVLTLPILGGKGNGHKLSDDLYTSLLWYFAALRSNVALGHSDYQLGDILQPLTEATMAHLGQDADFVRDTLRSQVKRTLDHLAERDAVTLTTSLGESLSRLMHSPYLSSQSGQVDAFFRSRYWPNIDTTTQRMVPRSFTLAYTSRPPSPSPTAPLMPSI
ncbi:hypothetical protein BS17DRAFT_176036 [Gyrodon lividus]|nr:hypothetical protein BS17DRAFT_176036 [Gyrodon lividus]